MSKSIKISKKRKVVAIFGGLIIGLINGFFGGGGGMLCVPLLKQGMKLEAKKAHATAILAILPISAVSLIIYMIGDHLLLKEGSITAGGVVAGGLFGALLLGKLPTKAVGIIFSMLMIAAGIKLLFF